MKSWKIKTDFEVKEAAKVFKKSIKCPDPESCDIQLGKEFYFSFPKNNNVFQNTNLSHKHTHTNLIKNEKSKFTVNHILLIIYKFLTK